jgi:hypothetical protein
MVFFFSALDPKQGHKVQHLFNIMGQIEFFFCISALTPSVKKPLGADFNFRTKRKCLILS